MAGAGVEAVADNDDDADVVSETVRNVPFSMSCSDTVRSGCLCSVRNTTK